MTRTFTEPRPPFGPERCQSNVGYQIKQHEHIVHLKEKKKERKKKEKRKKRKSIKSWTDIRPFLSQRSIVNQSVYFRTF